MKNEVLADTYHVYFERNAMTALKQFLKENSFTQTIILTDANVKKHCLPRLLSKLIELKKVPVLTVKAGEINKNLKTCSEIWEGLTRLEADRNTLLINFGGGVITDMGGFCASVFKRGIPFINIPTTSLSMADASVGGKTGIDFQLYKNHIGTFSNPLGVFVNTEFCSTQTKRALINGLAEVLKAGFIADKTLAEETSVFTKNLGDLIMRSVQIKNAVVMQDPKEKGLRKILNFGHTIGHAVESFYLEKKGKQLMHGEAIALGMICESWIALQLGMMKKKEFDFVETCINRLFKKIKLDKKDTGALLKLMQQDKKNSSGKIKLALIEKPGKHLLDVECNADLIKKSLAYYSK